MASFLGYGADCDAMPLVLCWVDAIHNAVLAHKRCRITGDPARMLVARVRVYQHRLVRSTAALKLVTDAFRPSAVFFP